MESSLLGLPFLTLRDTDDAAASSLDPLGLTPLGEQLAVELVPGVRERQKRPRFLTAIAVSHAVCDGFPPDTVARDDISEPWQVFEWYMVEGFVRPPGAASEASIPGSQKAKQALAKSLPLSASRYLKTPTVFGFHGVYRLLARTLRVEEAERLGEFGAELLDVWQKEQGLVGFRPGTEGEGRDLRRSLCDAVSAGLQAAATDRVGNWAGWRFFSSYLDPTRIGPKESELIWRQLRTNVTGFARELLDFLTSKEGRALEAATERTSHQAIKKSCSLELRTRIETIERYEWFCRLLHDAFESCRYELTQARRGMSPTELADLKAVVRAAGQLPDAFAAVEASLPDSDRRARFQLTFQAVADRRSPAELVSALLEHHQRVQKAKPPEGKAPWIEQHHDGRLLIRPDYQLDEAPAMSREYVNPYRLVPLRNFAHDLGKG